MPSKSAKQHSFMEAIAHNPSFAKKAGVPTSVGKHFHEADKGKKFKEGGHMKHANKLHGEAKETKAIAHEEMKALKRGHAPKKIMEHEKAEHKAMGYKHGGRIAPHPAKITKAETKQKGYAMAESSGGRKAPHSKKQGLEGDTHLKGFGMGKGLGHGRTVTRAATPKDEMPRKGFAMKHGGHVKHHTKHMARGGHAGMHRPKINPAALAAMMGAGAPPMGAPAGAPPMASPGGPPPMGGAPGMKHGGHVKKHGGHHIHHHHHYAQGGGVKNTEMTKMKGSQFVADRKGTEKMIGGGSDKSNHGDGRVLRGHTRAKQIKMASGGHVGSHPHRRGDGAAAKGHTRCKIV